MKHSPYLTYVRSFESAARHLSFTAAAEELNYTQSAVSNHVRSLEEFIGRPLFIRYTRSLSLTDLGNAYLPTIREALTQIDVATESILASNHDKKVVISCPISLAENWIPGCISDFSKENPNINITVHGTIWKDVEPEVADIRITVDKKDNAPQGSQPIWKEKLAVVCAPDYLVNGRQIRKGEDLLEANLIHILGRPVYWQILATHFNLTTLDLDGGTQTNASNVALECATQGMGCVVLPKSLIGTHISRGLLVEPFEFDLESPWSYYISKEDPSMTSSTKLLRNWLVNYPNLNCKE
ncbi:LysR substrate-binding domain-containing protein [Kiloniella sp.]|uniref:LysR substrate-binding domain-containing protein n=1 Tax=Kiloniella sp. TaxID=1938587 RepID=UPI003B01DC7D